MVVGEDHLKSQDISDLQRMPGGGDMKYHEILCLRKMDFPQTLVPRSASSNMP